MDLHNRSPTTGYFDPAVLGTVCDLLRRDAHDVCSERSGHVLTLRTYPRVLEGDMLAVILEVS